MQKRPPRAFRLLCRKLAGNCPNLRRKAHKRPKSPLYGRTDTKSPMVYSSMVHVAGGEEGSIRHDDDGRPAPSGGSPVSEEWWVHDDQVAPMIADALGMSKSTVHRMLSASADDDEDDDTDELAALLDAEPGYEAKPPFEFVGMAEVALESPGWHVPQVAEEERFLDSAGRSCSMFDIYRADFADGSEGSGLMADAVRRAGHPALMPETLGRVTHHRWRSSPWHI